MSTIPLAKGFSEKHLRFPVFLSHKIDGVPVRIDIDEEGNHTVRTRQGKPVQSVKTLVQELVDSYMSQAWIGYFDTKCTLIGEVHQLGNIYADFKETSGIVRRNYDQSHLLAISLFEMFTPKLQEVGFERRYEAMLELTDMHRQVRVSWQQRVENLRQLEYRLDEFYKKFPKAEGMVARNWDDPFMPGKRSWGYQKVLREPTIDLRIIGVEEAIDKDGNPKGMAGSLIASYRGADIGIGPGRLTHDERRELWHGWTTRLTRSWPNRIAQIKYKADDSYDALRQPTFQFWRDDKETPDA